MSGKWERLGETVRQRRERLGLAQGERPPSAATWRKVEKAIDAPYSRRTAVAICSALGWDDSSFDRLLAGEDPIELAGDHDDDPQAELTQTVRDLTTEVRLLRDALRQGGIGPDAP